MFDLKKKLIATGVLAGITTITIPTLAHCPLCSAATGGLLIVARTMGVSDLISGTLAGAFTVATALWTHNWLKKRNKGKSYIPFQGLILVLVSILLTILTLEAIK